MKLYKRKQKQVSGLDILLKKSPFNQDVEERARTTVSCRDCDYIKKVKNAGDKVSIGGVDCQVMHNGLVVVEGGYHGDWMSKIIKELKGHHEPQEEKVFYEVLERIDPGATMIELGSFWAYYSLWFMKRIKSSRAIACEPDQNNIEIGKKNAKLNSQEIEFLQFAAGSEEGKEIEFTLDSNQSQSVKTRIKTVDAIVDEFKITKLDLLHMDIQGVELDALNGAIETIKSGKLRFLFVSTHHYFFSGDPLTHEKCLEFIIANGGSIISQHSVLESVSGDGLIVASFDDRDSDFKVEVTINHTNDALFRPYEQDIALLLEKGRFYE